MNKHIRGGGLLRSESGWMLFMEEDDDGHLNIYIENDDGSRIIEVETGRGDGEPGNQLALRFTTSLIEENYAKEFNGNKD